MITITVKTEPAKQFNSIIDNYVNTYKDYLLYYHTANKLKHTTPENDNLLNNKYTSTIIKLEYYTTEAIKTALRENGWKDNKINNYLANNKEYNDIIRNSTKLDTLTRIKQFLRGSGLNV